jgi:hypothetical protein
MKISIRLIIYIFILQTPKLALPLTTKPSPNKNLINKPVQPQKIKKSSTMLNILFKGINHLYTSDTGNNLTPKETQNLFNTSIKMKIAILDSGLSQNFQKQHPEIILQNFTLDKNETDGFGHGTFTTSLLFNNSKTCPGMLNNLITSKKIQLHVLKVFNHRRFSSEQFIHDALEYCISNGIRIIALPFGTETVISDKIKKLMKEITYKGGVIISASGNEGPLLGTLTSPGDQDFVISVGSYKVNSIGNIEVSQFGSRGPSLFDLVNRGFLKFKPDVLVPGENIIGVDYKGGKCISKAGTSLSAILGI